MEESEKNMIQENVGELSEPVKSEKNDAGSEPEKSEKNDAGSEPVKSEKNDADSEPVKSEKNDAGFEPVKNEKNDADFEPVKSEKNDAGSEPEKSEKNDAGSEPVKSEKNDADSELVKSEKDDAGSEPVKSEKNDAGSEPEKNEKEDAAKARGENAAKDAGGYHAPETPEQLQAAIEAILFAMGDSVETAALAKALDKSAGEIRTALDALEARYETAGSGIMLQRFEDAVQLSTRPEQYQNLVRIAKVPKKVTLSDAVIETLSIIAYRQPITKAEIEQIRGVSCDYAINRLLSYDLIKELGRQDSPGRPILFGTTEQFLRSFGVQKIADLPQPSAATKEEFQQEAEAEVDERLNV